MNNKSLLYPVASTSRRVVSLDGMWRFRFDPKSEGVDADWANGLPESISHARARFLLRLLHR